MMQAGLWKQERKLVLQQEHLEIKLEGQVEARWWRTFTATLGSLKCIQEAVGTTEALVVGE